MKCKQNSVGIKNTTPLKGIYILWGTAQRIENGKNRNRIHSASWVSVIQNWILTFKYLPIQFHWQCFKGMRLPTMFNRTYYTYLSPIWPLWSYSQDHPHESWGWAGPSLLFGHIFFAQLPPPGCASPRSALPLPFCVQSREIQGWTVDLTNDF